MTLAAGQPAPYPYRWVYVSRGLRSDRDLEDIRGVAKTASEHGLTGIVLAAGLDRLDGRPAEYVGRVEEVARIAREYRLDIVPMVFSVGYGSSTLAQNRNLAEGLPVRDALFVARGGEARLSEEAPVKFAPVGPTLIDPKTRLVREISVPPYRAYRLTLRVKSEDFGPWNSFRVQVLEPGGPALGPADPGLAPTSDWHTVTLGFNSAGWKTPRIAISAAALKTGRIWVDDLRLEEAGLLNVLRRPGTPVSVRDEKTGQAFEEGKDFAPISDPGLNFRFDHDAPPTHLLSGGRIRDGQRLRVSYYHGMAINKGQVTVCMSEPDLYALWEKNARLIERHLAPRYWFLDMDEIPAGGTCEACRKRNLPMGGILARCISGQHEIIRGVNSKAEVAIWSDMLDPNHNARGNYYLVDGDYSGSWNRVPKDLLKDGSQQRTNLQQRVEPDAEPVHSRPAQLGPGRVAVQVRPRQRAVQHPQAALTERKDLRPLDLGAKWTPGRGVGRFGLHADSTIWLLLARAVVTGLGETAEGDEDRRSSHKDDAPDR